MGVRFGLAPASSNICKLFLLSIPTKASKGIALAFPIISFPNLLHFNLLYWNKIIIPSRKESILPTQKLT